MHHLIPVLSAILGCITARDAYDVPSIVLFPGLTSVIRLDKFGISKTFGMQMEC